MRSLFGRRTKVDKVQGFAELGIRMVNAAATFSAHFDPDNNEIVEAEDLVRLGFELSSSQGSV